jgi:hypothetical protein
MLHQLSIFVDNKPGKLEKITSILGEARVNIRAISIASAGDFGVVKILVDDTEKGLSALMAKGFAVTKKRILTAVVDDKPGRLHELLSFLSSRQINIEDCYGYQLHGKNEAVIVMEIDKFPEAESVLRSQGVRLLQD